VLIDRVGTARTVLQHPWLMVAPRLSPDERKIAVTVDGANQQIWVYDFARGSFARLTSRWDNQVAQWSADGRRVVFHSTRDGAEHLYVQHADGGRAAERLTTDAVSGHALAPDGESIIAATRNASTGSDLVILRRATQWRREPLVTELFDQQSPEISPDGRWLAYMSNETGRFEIYLRALPSLHEKWMVSSGGGRAPVWRRDGRELLYRVDSRFYAVAIRDNPFHAGPPTLLFEDARAVLGKFDVTRNGEVLFVARNKRPTPSLAVVTNWFAELRELLRD
jgi:Tol biopolymer transport system component